jgi:hypothetical protein
MAPRRLNAPNAETAVTMKIQPAPEPTERNSKPKAVDTPARKITGPLQHRNDSFSAFLVTVFSVGGFSM